MRQLWSLYDSLRWLFTGEKAWNKGRIKLARPSEVVNIEVGMVVQSVNRLEGSISFCSSSPKGKNGSTPKHRYPF